MHFVKEILQVEPFKIKLRFEDGAIRELQFENKLRSWANSEGSIYKQLLIPDNFLQVKLNNELETIQWNNGIDFCPDMLYEWSK